MHLIDLLLDALDVLLRRHSVDQVDSGVRGLRPHRPVGQSGAIGGPRGSHIAVIVGR